MISENDVIEVCEKFNIHVTEINNCIDSSKSDEDIRYNYVINNEFVLKINTNDTITERFLNDISSLQERYRSIGVYCPNLYKSKDGTFLIDYSKENVNYQCYVEEYASYKVAREVVETYEGKLNMLEHLGKLASKYTNVDLVENRSMWSIIDLAPLDEEIDEKQDNLNSLVEVLRQKNFNDLADKLLDANNQARNTILNNFEALPRCVYQGDLNPSNVLVDESGKFVGVLDFNLFGTEVNINCFINECMYYFEEADFDTLSATEIYEKMNTIREKLLSVIWQFYSMNDVELDCFDAYKKIIDISFYPNVELMKYYLEEDKNVDKVIQLITLLVGNEN